MSTRKKSQHYVFRSYLNPWSKNERIWCLRRGQIFRSNLTGIACERFFYKSYPLTDEERDFVTKAVIEVEGTPEPLKEVLYLLLDLYCFGHKAKEKLKSYALNIEPDQESELAMLSEKEHLLNTLIENGAEDWLAGIEDDFLPFLLQMREGKTEFYADFKSAGKFMLGLCVQSARTKRLQEASLRVMGQKIGSRNTRHMMSVTAHLMSIRLSFNLFRDRTSFKLEIIENESDTPFITADQPVINLHGDADPASAPPERLEFFYPISPKRAMVFLEKNTALPLKVGELSVNNYNVRLAQHSHEQIFSDSREYLESFSKIIGGVGSGNRFRSWK